MAEEPKRPAVSAGLYFIGAGAVIALLWGWYALEHLTDLRLTGRSHAEREDPIHVLFPLIATPVVLVGALVLWRRAAGIAANGVPVKATVESVGAACQSMRDVELSYAFEGREYRRKTSVTTAISDRLAPGDTLDVIVDRRNPKRMMVK